MDRKQARARHARRRRIGCLTGLLLLVVIGIIAWRFWPRAYYSARQLGIKEYRSATDCDGDGIPDNMDMVQGARDYIATDPRYESKYYDGGYPDDGLGVCTDVIWQAFRTAGYELKDMVDADIAEHRDAYPHIETVDSNIDFRRVSTLDVFFSRYAESLTTDFSDPAQWQAGDIVIFGDRDHIAICSDKRDKDGIPWIIHLGNPVDNGVERQDIYNAEVTRHYRWLG